MYRFNENGWEMVVDHKSTAGKIGNVAAFALSFIAVFLPPTAATAQLDAPLPSWNDGATKTSIIEFVKRVTTPGGPDFVAPEERIATFDNDGCLWSERPFYFQLAFAIDRVKALAPEHPEWKTEQPFKAILEEDLEEIAKSGKKGLLKLVMATHAGMTTEEFEASVREWLKTSRHPKFDRPYQELVFKPMLELLGYLRANGFKTFITSGGGIEFLRVFAEEVYGIPPEQVIGSSIKTKFEIRDGKPVIVRLPEINFIDDKEGKPIGIHQHIGRRPIAAFGNSDGDLQMLQWTAAGEGARFCLLVHHTDAVREWAYDRDSHIGKLDKALDEAKQRDWAVVDMKQDWKVIYPADHYYLHKQKKSHAAHWSYSGDAGPEHWGDLDPDYATAKTGRQQSPINIRGAVDTNLPKLQFKYQPSKVHLVYNGHAIQENEDPGSFGLAGGKRYELQQFHFHSPSEHTVNGKQYPMEMHLVHKSQDGTIGVLGVFIEEGEHNKAFDPLWFLMPDANHPSRDLGIKIDTQSLLPKQLGYFKYDGSFTTPPCTEQVKWVMLETPIALSAEQIKRFRSVINGNNRPVQALNGRTIQHSK
jgi:carbonic anhydrase/phosphoserine phosphatase